MMAMRKVMGYFLCTAILFALGYAIVLAEPPAPFALSAYFGFVMPFSIMLGRMIHPLTHKGLLVAAGVQCLAITGCAAMTIAAFSNAGNIGGGLRGKDVVPIISVAVVSFLPIAGGLWLWLSVLKSKFPDQD